MSSISTNSMPVHTKDHRLVSNVEKAIDLHGGRLIVVRSTPLPRMLAHRGNAPPIVIKAYGLSPGTQAELQLRLSAVDALMRLTGDDYRRRKLSEALAALRRNGAPGAKSRLIVEQAEIVTADYVACAPPWR